MASGANWLARSDVVRGGARYRLYADRRPLSFDEFLELLARDDGFSAWYTALLAGADTEAFFWEHPPLRQATLDRPAEFVLLDAPALAGQHADRRPFAAHFSAAGDAEIAVFENLGGDALLLAPCPRGGAVTSAHLAAFLRTAGRAQIRELWRQAAEALRRELGDEPRWLSTSGLGVPWLHLRIDQSPKYYQHVAYKSTA